MKVYCIPLYGGIGNIIQTIPLALWLKSQGYLVYGVRYAIDFPESESLLKGIFTDIVDRQPHYEFENMEAVQPRRLSFNARTTPEWAGWFVTYGLPVPEEVECKTNKEKMSQHFNIGICPTCKDNWPMKQYPHWRELVRELTTSYNISIGIFGFEKDGKEIQCGPNVHDMRGRRQLTQVAGLLSNCDVVIANEGGLAHLAAAQGTKTYILMGGSDGVKNLPPNNATPIYYMDGKMKLSCQPCQYRGGYIENNANPPIFYGCDPEHYKAFGSAKCLDLISPTQIIREIGM